MKKSLLILLFCGSLLILGQTTATAQDSGIGIGGIINAPTGLSAKAWFSESFAIDGAFSFSIGDNFSTVYFHSDVLQHSDAISSPELELYYGLGARLVWDEVTDDLNVGIRGPIGTEYSFEGTNLKSFIEVVPTLDFTPDARLSFAGAVGMRVYLD